MFLGIVARAYAEFDTCYATTCVIVSAFCATTNVILLAIGPDFNNIWTNGQVNPLPFSCPANPHIQLLWHEGKDKLCMRLKNNNDNNRKAKHHMLAIACVTLKAQVKQRMGTMCIKDAELCRHSGSSGVKDSIPPLPPGCPFSSYLWETGGFLSTERARKKRGEDKDFDSGGRRAQPRCEPCKRKSPHHYNNKGGRDGFKKYIFVESLLDNVAEDGGDKNRRMSISTAAVMGMGVAVYECDCVGSGKGGGFIGSSVSLFQL
jgi:hypothetical protein